MRVNAESDKAGLKLSIQKMEIMASSSITSWQIDGEKVEAMTDFIFLGSRSLWMVTVAMKLKDAPWNKSYDKHKQCIKKQRCHFVDKGLSSQSYSFSSSHVQV